MSKSKPASVRRSGAQATLKPYEAICVASVMEDCADQLAILGAIMPGSYESRKDAKKVMFIYDLPNSTHPVSFCLDSSDIFVSSCTEK